MNLILSIISGLVLTFTFPTLLFPLAYFALIPFLVAIDRAKGRMEAFLLGITFGIFFYGGVFFFINTLTDWVGPLIFLGFAGLSIFLSLYTGLFAWFLKLLSPRLNVYEKLLFTPLVFVAIEWIRSFGPYGIVPSIGYTQWQVIPVIQIAQITGVFGITFLVVLVNAAFKEIIFARDTRQRLTLFLIPLITFSAVYLYGVYALNTPLNTGESKKVVVIQGNHTQEQKMDFGFFPHIKETYLDLSASSKVYKPDIVVWPETAIPYYIQAEPLFVSQLCFLIREMNATFVIGVPRLDHGRKAYNSCAFFSGEGRFLGWQDKYNLVPFGEYMPGRNFLVPIFNFFGQSNYTEFLYREFSSSEYKAPVPTDSGLIGIGICVDSFFGNMMRQSVLLGADYLFVITNDAWFKRS
ncbi:MAG: apolipoprotein N-acyltransferase [Candidatus Saganbacteria bacterium]|nr:apolipoprotein N-acyltransferase [Candidatus Saganbacteria bacterium]